MSMPAIKVAIIEDSSDNLEVAKLILRHKVGASIVGGWASGAMFLKWFHDSRQTALNPHLRAIDLLLLDLQIPRESGFTVLEKLQGIPELAGTKIVAWTANTTARSLQECRTAGFDGFIGKPIAYERFPQQIQRILTGDPVWDA
ncbi:MAG TPA: response regulator [Herpetosiphonaceae bacterium]